jgi:hypothetical protein
LLTANVNVALFPRLRKNRSKVKSTNDRIARLELWARQGGVLSIGYEMFRLLVEWAEKDKWSGDEEAQYPATDGYGYGQNGQFYPPPQANPPRPPTSEQRKKMRVRELLYDPGPNLLTLDEGHRIKDHTSALYLALQRVRTTRRIVATGYPLQNRVMEYFTMVNWCVPSFLGSREAFFQQYGALVRKERQGAQTAANQGATACSRESQRNLIRRLGTSLAPIVLRRDDTVLREALKPKHEWVIICRGTVLQSALYKAYLRTRRTNVEAAVDENNR